MESVLVVINGTDRYHVVDRIDLGRASDAERGIVGLDPDDNGISRLAATIELGEDGCVIRNRSRKTSLYLIPEAATQPLVLRPGERFLITRAIGAEIRGLIRTHRIDMLVAPSERQTRTATVAGAPTFVATINYSEADLDALTAMFCGFLRPFPRRDPRPISYSEAGDLLGLPATTVRRRIEKIRERLRSIDVYIEGRHAAQELAEYVLDCGVISADDLSRLDTPR